MKVSKNARAYESKRGVLASTKESKECYSV
jgi:hypothetical protein